MKRALLLLTLVLVARPQSADLTPSTVPSRIFKENDGVVDAADSETFHLLDCGEGNRTSPKLTVAMAREEGRRAGMLRG
jgi:hypothetical protein